MGVLSGGVLQGARLYAKPRIASSSRGSAASVSGHSYEYSRRAQGVLTGNSQGIHRVLAWYLRDAQGMFKGFSRGTDGYLWDTHGVLTGVLDRVLVGYARGTHKGTRQGTCGVRTGYSGYSIGYSEYRRGREGAGPCAAGDAC